MVVIATAATAACVTQRLAEADVDAEVQILDDEEYEKRREQLKTASAFFDEAPTTMFKLSAVDNAIPDIPYMDFQPEHKKPQHNWGRRKSKRYNH